MFGVKPPPVRLLLPEDTVFLVIDKHSFDTFLQKHPKIGVKFQQELIRVLFIRLRNYAERFMSAY
jgi:hypothetical protein